VLVNEIGVADEQVVDIESRRVNVPSDPKSRETMTAILEAALAHLSGAPTPDAPAHSTPVVDIDSPTSTGAASSRTDAA
jgi:hypothetical protein